MVLVGSRKDSETYVRSKKKACAEVGIADFGIDLPEDATEQQVLEVRVCSQAMPGQLHLDSRRPELANQRLRTATIC